jgi:hypothetical protein
MGALSLLTAERRRFTRTRCSIPATLRTPNVTCTGLEAVDICADGLGLKIAGFSAESTVRLMAASRSFVIRLELPTGRVRARARLSWSVRIRENGAAAWRLGLTFVKTGPSSREAIRRFLQETAVRRMIENYADLGQKNLRRVFTS